MTNEILGDGPRRVVDAVSVGVAVGTVTDVLPALAALFTVIWTMIQIWETKTVQRLLGRAPAKGARDDG